jgi:hypothetical protein
MGQLQLCAWGDESYRTHGIDQPAYLLGAVVADPAVCDEYRQSLMALHRAGPKLHWRESNPRERTQAIQTIAQFDAYHVIVIAAPVERKRQERARALCLEQLAWHLDRHTVTLLSLEARETQLMKRDQRTIDALRGKHALPDGLRIDHARPSEEPMLWVADFVLGALGESMTGSNPD